MTITVDPPTAAVELDGERLPAQRLVKLQAMLEDPFWADRYGDIREAIAYVGATILEA